MKEIMALVGFFPQAATATNTISDCDMYFIVSCLPAAAKVLMFWNMVRNSSTASVSCDTLYMGLESMQYMAVGETAATNRVDEKVESVLIPRIICYLVS